MIPRLKVNYDKEMSKNLMNKLNVKNRHEVPKITKIVLNMGLGEDANDSKKLKASVDDLALITGQKPIITKFKKSISNFKTRKGSNAGAKVTLRSIRMYEFIDRLINIALPRVRDFDGLSPKSFDGNGNYAFGIKEHLIFPEINYESVTEIWGMDIIINTTAKNDEQALALLQSFNFPIKKK